MTISTPMPQDILNPAFWQEQLHGAEHLHHAVFHCPPEKWQRIEQRHREILAEHIQPADSVLDGGCAWGRMIDLLPPSWQGTYTGVDLSPDFIDMAKANYTPVDEAHNVPLFYVDDLRNDLHYLTHHIPQSKYDWAIVVSMRRMIIRNLGDEGWDLIQHQLFNVAKRILMLEYKEDDVGQVLVYC